MCLLRVELDFFPSLHCVNQSGTCIIEAIHYQDQSIHTAREKTFLEHESLITTEITLSPLVPSKVKWLTLNKESSRVLLDQIE